MLRVVVASRQSARPPNFRFHREHLGGHLKPHDANFKPDYYQYFFIVRSGDEHIFKYCVWIKKTVIEADEGLKKEMLTTGHKINQRLYEQAVGRVKEKIDNREFTNKLLVVDENGEEETNLDELEDKLN